MCVVLRILLLLNREIGRVPSFWTQSGGPSLPEHLVPINLAELLKGARSGRQERGQIGSISSSSFFGLSLVVLSEKIPDLLTYRRISPPGRSRLDVFLGEGHHPPHTWARIRPRVRSLVFSLGSAAAIKGPLGSGKCISGIWGRLSHGKASKLGLDAHLQLFQGERGERVLRLTPGRRERVHVAKSFPMLSFSTFRLRWQLSSALLAVTFSQQQVVRARQSWLVISCLQLVLQSLRGSVHFTQLSR